MTGSGVILLLALLAGIVVDYSKVPRFHCVEIKALVWMD